MKWLHNLEKWRKEWLINEKSGFFFKWAKIVAREKIRPEQTLGILHLQLKLHNDDEGYTMTTKTKLQTDTDNLSYAKAMTNYILLHTDSDKLYTQ